MKHPKTLARDALLHSSYGKFDLIENIIPQELLLTGKPRRVKEWLVKNLQIHEQEINENTLRSWLHRYRKAKHSKGVNARKPDWEQFEPTAVRIEKGSEKLIIKKVSNPKTV